MATDESNLLDLNESDESDDEVEGTTDSSFKAACYNVKLVAVNESSFSLEAFQELQQKDSFCSDKLDQLRKKQVKAIEAGYFLKKKILMRKMETADGQINNVLCVPLVLVKSLLESTHRSLLSGHFGSQRYYLNMSRKYYWPKMKDQIMEFHGNCLPCLYNDKFPVKYASGHVIRPLWPMHVVHCDLMVGLPRALDGSTAILLLYDGFSRFTYGIALTSEKADYCVKKLMSHYVAAFGLPWALHSDNGRNVDGALIRHLALMLGVVKTSTPPYTPNANPTETMCGAVAQLLRKGLSESDRRYWSLCLPFILNALNSTVHTATGYTPNSLFFGRYQERDLVPLIPFDCESSTVNEYFQKMRRFQELSFQIVRSRNERKLLAKKDSWDENSRNPPYSVGDYVLVKNNAPASGPGKMKLRSKYIGPFRVIKAYLSSLIVVPWTQNARLEEYYRDPNVFRLIHRGDIKPFHTRQVAVKHCKPFKGDINTEEIVDPIMLSRFLDDLGVNNDSEILSEIDPDSTITDSSDITGSGSTRPPPSGSDHSRGPSPPPPGGDGDGDDHLPRPPRYDDPDPEVRDPPIDNQNNARKDDFSNISPEMQRFIESLEISDKDRELLKQYCQIKNEMEDDKSVEPDRRLDKIKDFIQSSDPRVRERAEYELKQVLVDMKFIEQQGLLDKHSEGYEKLIHGNNSDVQNDDQIKSEDSEPENEPVQAVSNPASVQGDPDEIASVTGSQNSILDLDDEQALSMPSGDDEMDWDPAHDFVPPIQPPVQQNPNINITLPNLNINITQPQANVDPFARRPAIARSPAERARHGNVADWLEGQSPRHGQGPPAQVVTRSGRLSKTVTKFDPTIEARLQADTRTAMRLSSPKAVKRLQKTTVKSTVVVRAPVKGPATTAPKRSVVESKKAESSAAKAKTVVESEPSKSKVSEVQSKNDVTEEKPSDDISKRSGMTVRTPVKDDISKRSAMTARTPPSINPGAYRLSDDEDNLFN